MGVLGIFVSLPAWAATSLGANECAISVAAQDTKCVEADAGHAVSPDSNISSSVYNAVRSDPGLAAYPIDAWGTCRYVDNSNTSTSFFVPFKSALEWSSFVSNYPAADFHPVDCTRPGVVVIPANYPSLLADAEPCYDQTGLQAQVPQYYTMNTYERFNTPHLTLQFQPMVSAVPMTFSCYTTNGNKNGAMPWIKTVTLITVEGLDAERKSNGQYTGSNASPPNSDWQLDAITYSGAPVAMVNGQCGVSNGVASSTSPTSLCLAGSQSPVGGGPVSLGGPGTWSWTCSGSNGGTSASCSAPATDALVDGQCGAGNGVSTDTTPTNLCTAGNPSGVSGGLGYLGRAGTWSWTCDGTGGGTTASCSAPAVGKSCIATWNGGILGIQTVTLASGTGRVMPYGVGSNPTWMAGMMNTCHSKIGATFHCDDGVATMTSPERITSYSCDSCFPPDAPVLTPDRGWIPIATIQPGDQVVSFDAKGHHTAAIVQGLKITPDRKLRRINGIVISTLQKVQMASGKYKRVEALKIGDVMVDIDSKPVRITKLENMPGLHTVYNLVFDNHDTPFYAAGVRVKDWQ